MKIKNTIQWRRAFHYYKKVSKLADRLVKKGMYKHNYIAQNAIIGALPRWFAKTKRGDALFNQLSKLRSEKKINAFLLQKTKVNLRRTLRMTFGTQTNYKAMRAALNKTIKGKTLGGLARITADLERSDYEWYLNNRDTIEQEAKDYYKNPEGDSWNTRMSSIQKNAEELTEVLELLL